MTQFLISLDEVERVKRMHHITSTKDLAERTKLARSTWTRALSTRKPTPDVLDALAALGARSSKVLISEDMSGLEAAA
jgi:hypothetical protein